MTLLVLRPEPQAGRMVADLAAAGVAAVAAPMLAIVAYAEPVRRVVEADPAAEALILSSPQAARILGEDAAGNVLFDRPVIAVGPGTAAAARAAGFRTVLAAGGNADSLVGRVAATGLRRLVHAVGRDRVGEVAARLAALGRAVAEVEIYRAELIDHLDAAIADGLCRGAFGGLVVASARTSENFRRHVDAGVGLGRLGTLGLAAISAAAAAPLAVHCAQTLIAARPDGKALMETAIALAARLDQTGGRPT